MKKITFLFFFMLLCQIGLCQKVAYLMYLSEDKPCEFGSFKNQYSYDFKVFPNFQEAKSYYYGFENKNKKDSKDFFGVSPIREGEYYLLIESYITFPNNCKSNEKFRRLILGKSSISLADAKSKAEKELGYEKVVSSKIVASGQI